MSELREWLQERPVWLQHAALRCAQQEVLSEEDLADLVSLVEAEIADPSTVPEPDLNSVSFDDAPAEDLILISVGSVQGIELLNPKAPLCFAEGGVTVVYGENGSGKSGYVRILKQACGARTTEHLLPSVFEEDPPDPCCTIRYSSGGEERTLSWTPEDGPEPDLQHVDIFDRGEGRLLASEENDVSYEPPILQFISRLTTVSQTVSSALQRKEEQLSRIELSMPEALMDTAPGRWLQALDHSTPIEETKDRCRWAEQDEEDIQSVQKRLAEDRPAARASALNRHADNLDNLISRLERSLSDLSDTQVKDVLAARGEAEKRRKLSDEAAKVLSDASPLPAVGSEVWRALWDAARKYSEELAYPGSTFPNLEDDSRCVLCQRTLDEETQARFRDFEGWVAGALERDAQDAADLLAEKLEDVEPVLSEPDVQTQLDAAGVEDDRHRSQYLNFMRKLRVRRTILFDPDVEDVAALPLLPSAEQWVRDGQQRAIQTRALAKKLNEDAEEGARERLEQSRDSLLARKWLSNHQEAITARVDELGERSKLNGAMRLCDTTALSRKKGELAESLITEAFAKRFEEELENLGGRYLPVSLVKTRTQRGRVLHKLRLDGVRPADISDVLSEGEFRVISLAAVLADGRGNPHPAPFVFDDPITSLDQEFEERVVERLIEVARARQLIVFTHRLSLLGLIDELCSQMDVPITSIWLRREHWGSGEPGGVPLYARRPEGGLNVILHNEIPVARRILEEEGRVRYDAIARGMTTEIRILIERLIEDRLLSGVVKRHRRSIQTMGRLNGLAAITEEDCALIDEMMTKYSAHMHSQSAEAPVLLPAPDEIASDLRRIVDWVDDFKKRT